MKLKEWAAKTGISYLTAWRWFKAKDPRLSKAYQSDSGTIIVPDELENLEQTMASNTQNNAMSLFLKKTVEYSVSNSTVEDFAAYILSNFSFKLNAANEPPKYSKQKPKSEDVQKHFQQFLPDKEKGEHLKEVVSLLKEGKSAGDIVPAMECFINNDEYQLTKVIEFGPPSKPISNDVLNLEKTTEGLIQQSVDFNTTPQLINYDSTNQAFSSSLNCNESMTTFNNINGSVSTFVFQPTQKELQSVNQIQITETKGPRKRGRKSRNK